MKKILLAILVCTVFLAGPLSADTYIKQNNHTDEFSIMGQTEPAKDGIDHLWIGKNKMARHATDQSIVIDLDNKVMYLINHEDKFYVEMTLPLDLSKYFPTQMMEMMGDVSIEVKPKGETKTFGKWKCEGYDVAIGMMMMDFNQTVWASKDVSFDWKSFNEKMLPQVNQALMRLSEDALKEMTKIEGFQIRTEATMSFMGSDVKSWTEVIEIAEKSAPEGTYAVPEGYTKKDRVSMTDLR